MAKKGRGRTEGIGQVAISFSTDEDVSELRVQSLPPTRDLESSSLAISETGPTHTISSKEIGNNSLTIEEFIDKYGSPFIEHNGEAIHYSWYLLEISRESKPVEVEPVGEKWMIDFKVYDIVFASSIRFFPMPMSVIKKHPEGIVIKPGIYSVEGICTEEDINELYKWASTRSDFKILGTIKLETPVENETARINLEDC